MDDLGGFLTDLALVLGCAGLTSALCQRLRQPAVLGYLLAGLIIGPKFPLPLVANPGTVRTLAELGVILLMFSLGLEFSVRKLLRFGMRAGVIVAIDVSLMLWLGALAGRLFGWSRETCVFAGAICSISSTMIVAKTLADRPVERRLKDLVTGVLIVQDVAAILLIAMLSALVAGSELGARELARNGFELLAFLTAFVGAGLFVVPRLVRWTARTGSQETLLIVSVGLCFSLALVAKMFDYSVALGAFVAGSLAAESGESGQLERSVRPLRDVFAAIFFVAVGMSIDPALVVRYWPAVLVFAGVVVLGKTAGISLGAFLSGHGLQPSIRAGLYLAQIGEFSYLIAALALANGPEAEPLLAIAVAVSVLTTFLTALLSARSTGIARRVDAAMPERWRQFATLYTTWVEGLRPLRAPRGPRAPLRRLAFLIAVDAALLAALVISVSLALDTLVELGASWTGLSRRVVLAATLCVAALAASPFLIGLCRCVGSLGVLLAAEVLPEVSQGERDPAVAPRRALAVGLQLTLFALIGAPFFALTQPFVPLVAEVGVLLLLLLVLGFSLGRSATKLEGHLRAGAEVIVEVLGAQMRESAPPALDQVRELLPGFGELSAVTIEPAFASVGRDLGALELRGQSETTVVCILRGEEKLLFPGGSEEIRAGDVLVLSGSPRAVGRARRILAGERAPAVSEA